MATFLELVSPTYLGDEKLTIEVDSTSEPLLNYRPITINFGYTDADAEGGIILPLILTIQPASASGVSSGYKRKFFNRLAPSSYTFSVPSAGKYLITLREFAHNNWQGRLQIEVGGDQVPVRSTRERQA